jgi:nitroreductase
MLDLDQAIRERHSTRMFLSRPVPRGLVNEALALAERAPTRLGAGSPTLSLQGLRARTQLRRTLCSHIGFYEDTDTRIGVPHFLATQYLRTKGIKPQ